MNHGGESSGQQSTTPVSRQSTLPISRASGSAYERPERARTSHACEPCRERKTKCDGERPSCRRCSHTGTPCHYGYGKGWRKRKTAEDLTATSRRLQRYETLLNSISPLVSPQVRSMIEEAREQEQEKSPSSDTTEGDTPMSSTSSSQPAISSDRSQSRLPQLPLPLPNPLMPGGPPRVPTLSSFDSMSSSTSSPQRSVGHGLHRSSDDASANRLPSIRPDGMLVAMNPPSGPGYFHSSEPVSAIDTGAVSPFRMGDALGEMSKQRSAPAP